MTFWPPFELRSLLMACPSIFYISVKSVLFGRDWAWSASEKGLGGVGVIDAAIGAHSRGWRPAHYFTVAATLLFSPALSSRILNNIGSLNFEMWQYLILAIISMCFFIFLDIKAVMDFPE